MDPEFVAAVARAAHGEKINIAGFCREHAISWPSCKSCSRTTGLTNHTLSGKS